MAYHGGVYHGISHFQTKTCRWSWAFRPLFWGEQPFLVVAWWLNKYQTVDNFNEFWWWPSLSNGSFNGEMMLDRAFRPTETNPHFFFAGKKVTMCFQCLDIEVLHHHGIAVKTAWIPSSLKETLSFLVTWVHVGLFSDGRPPNLVPFPSISIHFHTISIHFHPFPSISI